MVMREFRKAKNADLSAWRRDLLARAQALFDDASSGPELRRDLADLGEDFARFARNLAREEERRPGKLFARLVALLSMRYANEHEKRLSELLNLRADVLPQLSAERIAAYLPELQSELNRLVSPRHESYPAYQAILSAVASGHLAGDSAPPAEPRTESAAARAAERPRAEAAPGSPVQRQGGTR
jgi:hypothetical protein